AGAWRRRGTRELGGDGGTSGGGPGGSGGIAGGSIGGGGGATPKCNSTANWKKADLGDPSDVSSPILVTRKDDWVVAWIDSGNVKVRSVGKDLVALAAQDISSPGNASKLRVAFNSKSEKLGFVWFDTTLEFASV